MGIEQQREIIRKCSTSWTRQNRTENNENEKLKDYLITNEYSISHTKKRFIDVIEK